MQLQWAIWKTEARLLALLVGEALLRPLPLILVVNLPVYLVLVSLFYGAIETGPMVFYLAAYLAAIFGPRLFAGPPDPQPDPPLIRPLPAEPALAAWVSSLAARLRRTAPTRTAFALAPVPWQQFGPDLTHARRDRTLLPLPAACLTTWSLPELEAHLARHLLSYHGLHWLHNAADRAITRRTAEHFQSLNQEAPMARLQDRLLHAYIDTRNAWRFLTDLQADLRAARLLGPAAVATLAYKAELATALVPAFLTTEFLPALDQNALLPIAESYAAYAATVDPFWQEAVNDALAKVTRDPAQSTSSLVARLAALNTIPAAVSVHDPRPAAGLFADFPALEHEVAANELGAERIHAATPISLADSARLAILPRLREELDRNRHLLDGHTRFDIPTLLRRKTELAAAYKSTPHLLLAGVQREGQIAWLLAAFLTLDLVAQQWDVAYQPLGGIQLRHGARELQPFALVEQLAAGEITEADFLEAIQ